MHEYGGPEVLKFEDLPVGDPGPGEVRVRIQAIGLNRAEAAFRSGHYIEKARLPARIGYEAAGVIEALGSGVEGFTPGEAVCVIPAFSMNRYGVYAERAIVPANALVKRPPGLDDAEAAAIWMALLTAYGALIDICEIERGDAVVITAASSSVGLAAIQIANSVGAIPVAVTRSADKRAGLLAAGAAHVIVSGGTDIAAEVMRITGNRGARMVFDPVGGLGTPALAATLAPRGVLVLYGNLGGEAHQTPYPFGLALARGLSLRGYLVFELIQDPQRFAQADAFIRAGLQAGTLKPHIAEVFPFDRIVDAHRYLEANQQLGKVVVTLAQ
jgi:NADPH:quinone reductase-like Zn-dependent oxidoreductase